MKKELSYEEKSLVNIMNHLESMAVVQAERILTRLYDTSKGQAGYIVKHLCDIELLKMTPDHKYIYRVGMKKDMGRIMDQKAIAAIAVALDMITRVEDISFAQRTDTASSTDISFTADGKLYKTLTLNTETMYRLYSYQEQVLKEAKQVDKKYPEVLFTTILIFHSSDTEDEMFDALDGMDIKIPHILIRFKSNDYCDNPQYDRYDMEA